MLFFPTTASNSAYISAFNAIFSSLQRACDQVEDICDLDPTSCVEIGFTPRAGRYQNLRACSAGLRNSFLRRPSGLIGVRLRAATTGAAAPTEFTDSLHLHQLHTRNGFQNTPRSIINSVGAVIAGPSRFPSMNLIEDFLFMTVPRNIRLPLSTQMARIMICNRI